MGEKKIQIFLRVHEFMAVLHLTTGKFTNCLQTDGQVSYRTLFESTLQSVDFFAIVSVTCLKCIQSQLTFNVPNKVIPTSSSLRQIDVVAMLHALFAIGAASWKKSRCSIFEQQRFSQACASAQSRQNICCSLTSEIG